MFQWAADAERGGRMPAGFRNPFLRGCVRRRRTAVDMTAEPDITVEMATRFLQTSDDYQLKLFAPVILCGLRAAEPVYLFHEHVEASMLTVPCFERLDHATKGRRNKCCPLLPALRALIGAGRGLIYVRRAACRRTAPLLGTSLEELVTAYERRCRRGGRLDAAAKLQIRAAVLRDAGAITYDLIQGEFKRIADRLHWPRQATLKDFRHLFSTAMANGGLPEHERRHLMGHAPGRDAIVVYTHLTKLAEHYRLAVEREFEPLLEVIRSRAV
jgi:integrase